MVTVFWYRELRELYHKNQSMGRTKGGTLSDIGRLRGNRLPAINRETHVQAAPVDKRMKRLWLWLCG